MSRYLKLPDWAEKAIGIGFPDDTPDWYMEQFRGFMGVLKEPLAAFARAGFEFGRYAERGIDLGVVVNNEHMTSWVRERALPYLEGKGLDVCCGQDKVKPDATGVDDGSEFGNGPEIDEVRDACNLRGLEGQDYVFSAHGLEHIPDWERALLEWARVLKPGGNMFLYLPYPLVYPPWSKEHEPKHKHDFTPEQISGFLADLGMDIVVCEEDRPHASFIVVASKG